MKKKKVKKKKRKVIKRKVKKKATTSKSAADKIKASQEATGLCTIKEVDPATKQKNEVLGDMHEVYKRLVKALKKEEYTKDLQAGLKVLITYYEKITDDPLVKMKQIAEMSDKQLELAKAICKEQGLIKEISDQQDTSSLFGR